MAFLGLTAYRGNPYSATTLKELSMRKAAWLLSFVCGACLVVPVRAAPEKVSAPDGCPTVLHVPLVTVVRGTPAVVTAKIACETGLVREVSIFIRLTDAGKPTSLAMSDKGEGVYEATVPVSMFRGISRFWYYIDARGRTDAEQTEDGVAQTRWYPVTILDGNASEGGAGGTTASRKTAYWLIGGAAAVAGAFVIDNNQGHGGGGGGGEPAAAIPAPVPSNQNDDEEEEEDEDEEDTQDSVPPPCVVTGSESVDLQNTLPCVSSDLEIRVCNTCSNTTLEASGSWGATDQVVGYNGEGCAPSDPAALILTKPGAVNYIPGEFTITVTANGQTIATIPWPSAQDVQDCL